MNDYLQQLERLGHLHTSGVLSDEEFAAEKRRILDTREPAPSVEPPIGQRFWSRRKYVLTIAALSVAAIAAMVGIVVTQDINSRKAEASPRTKRGGSSIDSKDDAVLDFADTTSCLPGTALKALLERVAEAGRSTDVSGRLVFVRGDADAVDADVTQSKMQNHELTVSRIALTKTLSGLSLSELRTFEWAAGAGFRMTFKNSPNEVQRVFHFRGAADNGDSDKSHWKSIESQGDKTIVTCLESKTAKKGSEAENDHA